MELFNVVFRVICLHFAIFAMNGTCSYNVLASSYKERLESLENIVKSLVRERGTINTGNCGNKEGSFINDFFEKKIIHLEKKLIFFEESLAQSHLRVKELTTTVSKLQDLVETSNRKNNIVVSINSKRKTNSCPNQWIKMFRNILLVKNSTELVTMPIAKSHSYIRSTYEDKGSLSRSRTKQNKPIQEQNPWYKARKALVEAHDQSGNTTSHPTNQDGVAFSAYIAAHETEIFKGFTIPFDTVVTNIGNHYDHQTGIFTAPQHGVYVFAWTLYCHAEGYIFSQLVVNSDVVGAMVSDGELQGATNIRTATGVIVVGIRQGDAVFIRTHPTKDNRHNLYSDPAWRSSFNGWRIQ